MKPLMKQRLIMMGYLLFGIFGGLFAYNLMRDNIRQILLHYVMVPPPVTVSATVAKSQTWQPTLQAVGTLVSVQGVDVTTQSPGKVTEINFVDGQKVQSGDLLVKLDDGVQAAQLEDAIAQEQLAAIAVKRYRPLLKSRAISPFKMDQLVAQFKEAQAQVAEAKANLSYLHIKAPFDGRLGIRQVDLGQYISPGTTLVVLESEGTLFVDFNLSEQYWSDVFLEQEVTLTTDAVPNQSFRGIVTAISPEIDQTTRTFEVRATVPNPDNALSPGSFADVQVHLKEKKNVITVPKTAVSYSLYGDIVYVIEKSKKKTLTGKSILTVKRVTVQPGMEQGDEVAITSGLQANDRVVTAGQIKLENGSRVEIKNDPLVPPKTIPIP